MEELRIPIVAAVVDTYYFKTITGRDPISNDELESFAHSIKKGVEHSIDWDSINEDAKNNIKTYE